jgi:hypothetical protein
VRPTLRNLLLYGGTLSPAQTLARLLADGNTLADYNAALGVTGTLNFSAWADQSGLGHDQLQATGAAQPSVISAPVPSAGSKYFQSFNTSGNFISTPNRPASTLTGDMSAVVTIIPDSVAPATANSLLQQYPGAGQRNWFFQLNGTSSGKLIYGYSVDGTSGVTKTASVTLASVGLANAQLMYLGVFHDVDNGAAGNDVKFYWSLDKITWTQLGTTQTTAGTVTRLSSNGPIEAFSLAAFTTALQGRGYRAELYSGNYFAGTGALVADCHPSDAATALYTNGATFTAASTGEVWTLTNTASGKLSAIVADPLIVYDGAAQFSQAAFATAQPVVTLEVSMLPMWTNAKVFADGVSAGTMRLKKSGVTPAITLDAGSEVASNTGMTLRAFHLLTAINNGAGSSLQVDGNATTTGNAGAGNPGGLTMGADGAGLNFGSVWTKRKIVRSSTANLAAIQAALRALYGTP